MSSAAPRVGHVDDARDWTLFGDDPEGDAVWYLHRQEREQGADVTMRCGLFRVAPVASELTLPYHETIVTIRGEGRTGVGDREVEIEPGRLLFLEKGATARFAPASTNLEFIVVVEVDGETPPTVGIAAFDGAAPTAVGGALATPELRAGTVELAAGEHDEARDGDRAFYVAAGEGVLHGPDGSAVAVRTGTFGFVPRGSAVRWTVDDPLRLLVSEVR